MFDKFLEWVSSTNFVWFMFGWSLCELLNTPTILNGIVVLFWLWIITRE